MLQQYSASIKAKKKNIIKWIRSKADYSKEGERKPYIFQGNVSFSDCQLPPLDIMPQTVRHHYSRHVLDEDMKSFLEKSHDLNRFSQATQLQAVSVPKDGNSLLHAVSVSVWGVDDSRSTLRHLIFISVKNDLNFKKRWCSQRMRNLQSSAKCNKMIINNEWDDLVSSLSNTESTVSPLAIPSGFSYSFYIYVLANILRRPIIIVTNNLITSVTGHSSQNDNISGLYLPLEWTPIDCCKTPIIIGYRYNHFCPLISEAHLQDGSHQQGKQDLLLFPLVNRDLGFLLIRYLTEKEDSKAWDLVQSYLLVKELDVIGNDGSLTKIPCAQMSLNPLERTYNPMFEHLDLMKDTEFLDTSQTSKYLHIKESSHINTGKCGSEDCIQQGIQNQDNHVLMSEKSHRDCGGNLKLTLEPMLNITEDNALTPTAPLASLEPQSHLQMLSVMTDRCRNQCGYRCSSQTYPFCHQCYQTEMERNKAEGQCVIKPVEDPKCDEENKTELTSEHALNSTENYALTPTAPFPSLELQSHVPLLSMMTDRCRSQCGYRCSYQTFPFCHECYQTEVSENKQEEEQSNTTAAAPSLRTETVLEESKFKGKGSVLARATTINEPGVLDMNMAVINPSVSSLNSPSASLHSVSRSLGKTEKSSLHKNKHLVQVSELLLDKSESLQCWNFTDQNSENYEHKFLDYNISTENQKKIRSTSIAHHQKASGELNRSEKTANNGSAGPQCKESTECFAEVAKNSIISNDTKILSKLTSKVKCSSPYCWTFISRPDQLCNKCQDILKHGTHQKEECLEKIQQTATQLSSYTNAVMNHFETEQELHKIQISVFDCDKSEVPLLRENKSWLERDEKSLDSCRRILSGSVPTGKSLYGSYIHQPSGEEDDNVSSYQIFHESVKGNEHSSCSVSSWNEDITCAHKYYTNVPLEATHSAGSKTDLVEFYNKATLPSQLATPNPLQSRPLMSTEVEEINLPYSSASLNSDVPPLAYSSSYKSFQPSESTFLPAYYVSPASVVLDLEPKSAIVTSKTAHNTYGSKHQLHTDSFDLCNQKANTSFTHSFQEIDNWKSSAAKCKSVTCPNYGNRDKEGYCNACFKIIRRQRIIEREAKCGIDVPDCLMLDLTLEC